MWTLILVLAITAAPGANTTSAISVDHIDGFASEQACMAASNKIAQERKAKPLTKQDGRFESRLRTYCVQVDQSVSP